MFLGIYNIATMVTYLGLISSFFSMYFALNNRLDISLILFLLAGFFDLYDGVVARKFNKTEEENKFGIQIDSIIDVINFGITPIVIGVSIGMNTAIDIALFLAYIFAATMRLAYFNICALKKEDNKPLKHYTGLPVTYVSSILPTVILIMIVFFNSNLLLLRLAFAALTILYILKIKIPKPMGKWYYIFPIMGVIVITLIAIFI